MLVVKGRITLMVSQKMPYTKEAEFLRTLLWVIERFINVLGAVADVHVAC